MLLTIQLKFLISSLSEFSMSNQMGIIFTISYLLPYLLRTMYTGNSIIYYSTLTCISNILAIWQNNQSVFICRVQHSFFIKVFLLLFYESVFVLDLTNNINLFLLKMSKATLFLFINP